MGEKIDMTDTPAEGAPPEFLWGAPAIAKAIGKSEQATRHMIRKRQLPVGKVGGQWVTTRQALLEHVASMSHIIPLAGRKA